MQDLPDLKTLSDEAKDALIEALWKELQALRQPEQNTQRKPKKTAKNSSLPPSKGFKANLDVSSRLSATEGKRVGHHDGGRPLHPAPDQRVSLYLEQCPQCGSSLSAAQQQLVRRYDKIELPAIQPVVTQVNQYGCRCQQCAQYSEASVPEALAVGSPFGARIRGLITYLRYGHAISYERLSRVMQEVFGLEISEGGN